MWLADSDRNQRRADALGYRRGVSGGSPPASSQTEQLRALVPVFALAVAIVGVVTDPSSAADLILAGLAVAAFAAWSYVPGVPLAALSLAVVVPVVVAQRDGQLEPLLFEVSLLGFVIGRWAPSLAAAVALGVLAVAAPVAASVIQDPSEISVGIWIMGVVFPWIIGLAAARQAQLTAQLDASRRELAEQAVDDERGLLWLKRAKQSHVEALPKAVVPGRPIPQTAQQAALRSLAQRVCDRGLSPAGELDGSCDLRSRRAPRLRNHPPGEPLQENGVDIDALKEQVGELEDSGLFIQGPPGSGKTWAGARLAVHLLGRGLRVGVAATSHKAIHNFLDEVEDGAVESGVSFRGLKKSSGDSPDSVYHSAHIESSKSDDAFPPSGEYGLTAGTAWLWARESMHRSVDVLFVDEAGQVSLADALAAAQATRSVVLLGNPQQLAHVSQGTHPHHSGSSVLEHLLGETETVAPENGVFLDRTYRMHPSVCRFVSNAMYDGRLEPVDGLERQAVHSAGPHGAGLRHLEVEHADNRQTAPEEAERIADEVNLLLGEGRVTEADGNERRLTLEDILIVAPYNAQVRCLAQQLPDGARVGTVDKFQGQQAPVVFFSMTSSTGEDVPRGMDFLFSRNRLNVAVSRAQVLAAVFCSPSLLWARCNTVEQMRLANLLCEFAAEAERQAGAGVRDLNPAGLSLPPSR